MSHLTDEELDHVEHDLLGPVIAGELSEGELASHLRRAVAELRERRAAERKFEPFQIRGMASPSPGCSICGLTHGLPGSAESRRLDAQMRHNVIDEALAEAAKR